MLRDPVHGDVYLTHEELAVLDTPEMQRLRGVRQLGTAYLVYPGAVHTRFEHSIGTLHLARRMIEAINLNFELDPRGCLGVSDEEARVIRMAALVHDVTHIPFGHNIEDQTGLIERHDSAPRFRHMLGRETELGRTLESLGLARDVLGVLLPPGEPEHDGLPPYWSQVLSDTICADILDYLERDATYTGLRLGVDDRLINYFKVDRESANLYIDLAKRDLLREDILSEIVRVLEARYYFSERVYYHHAKVAAGALVAKAVELALGTGAIDETDLYGQTDASLLDLLTRERAGLDRETARRIGTLVDCFASRRLPKRACVFPRYENTGVQEELVARYFARESHAERCAVEARIADLVRFATGQSVEVIVYCPAAHMQLKEVATHVRWPSGIDAGGSGGNGAVRPLSDRADRVPRLKDLEQSYRDLWKFYVLADAREPELLRKVQEVAQGEFEGARNVYRVEG